MICRENGSHFKTIICPLNGILTMLTVVEEGYFKTFLGRDVLYLPVTNKLCWYFCKFGKININLSDICGNFPPKIGDWKDIWPIHLPIFEKGVIHLPEGWEWDPFSKIYLYRFVLVAANTVLEHTTYAVLIKTNAKHKRDLTHTIYRCFTELCSVICINGHGPGCLMFSYNHAGTIRLL